jgi:multisubunit Na+/H+ antiporter MnhC subunit
MPRTWSYRQVEAGYTPPRRRGLPAFVIAGVLFALVVTSIVVGFAIYAMAHPAREVPADYHKSDLDG